MLVSPGCVGCVAYVVLGLAEGWVLGVVDFVHGMLLRLTLHTVVGAVELVLLYDKWLNVFSPFF